MRDAGAFEAENKLGTLLDWVASGEEVLITRHGKAVARLVSATPTVDRARRGWLLADSLRAAAASRLADGSA